MPDGSTVLETILKARLGLDRASIGPGTIPRAVKARMRALGLSDPADYESRAVESEDELQALIDEVVVPESWFFRDGLPFDFLGDLARTGWTARPSRRPLRVLSFPCAGGEEPYSIAATLDEAGLPASRCWIEAVDVSARRLEFARRGVYSRNALRGVAPPRVERWFQPVGDGFEIAGALHPRVHFRLGNILEPPPTDASEPFDVVFCRNLLIYLDREARIRAEAHLDRYLAPDGVLIVGHADALGVSDFGRGLVPAGPRGAFAYRRRSSADAPARPVSFSIASLATWAAPLPSPPPRPSLPPPRPSPPALSSPPAASPPPSGETAAEDSRPWMVQAAEHANHGRSGQALVCCERELRRAGPSAAVYSLMGGIHQAAGRRSEAEALYRKAIYLDPAHDEALLALALLVERRGDRDAAAALRRRADRALKIQAERADNNTNPGRRRDP